MRLVNLARIIIFMFAIASTIQTAVARQPPQTVGSVRGRVVLLDWKSGIEYVDVTLKGTGITHKTKTDAAGNYLIEAPPGIYCLSFSAEGTCPLRLAQFELTAAARTVPTVALVPCLNIHILKLGGGESTKDEYEFKEDVFQTGATPPSPRELLINFSSRLEANGIVNYRGQNVRYDEFDIGEGRFVERKKYIPIMISYNGLLLYADAVHLNQKDLKLNLEGNVIIDDGKQRIQAKRAAVNFMVSHPVETIQVKQ